MSFQDCIDAVKAAAGRDVSDAEAEGLFQDIELKASQLRRSRPDLAEAELQRLAADELAVETDMAARVEARNRKQNLMKRLARAEYYDLAPDPVMGVEAKLVGVNTPFKGARLSVDAQGKALTRDYVAGLTTELKRQGLFKMVRTGKQDRAIAAELFELAREGGTPGVSGVKAAGQAATIIHKFQEVARLGMNRAGAWVGQYEGWIARTAHDPDRLLKAGYESWRAKILETLDHERTFAGVADPEAFLKSVYNALVSGVHLTPDGMQGFKDPAFKGPGNLAKRLSQGRKLHFKDASTWMDYQADFGGKTLAENIIQGLSQAARNTALMREFGTNPRAEFEADLMRLTESWRDRDPKLAAKILEKSKMLANRFDELDGSASRPVNRLAARIGSSIRIWQSMSKLGGATLSAVTDIPLKAAELKYQGIGLLEGYLDGVTALIRGRGHGEEREVIDLLRAGTDGIMGSVASRIDVSADTPPGTLSKLANTFFQWSGLTYWTDAQRAGAEFIMSRRLGSLVERGFADLPDETKRLLKLFDVSEGEWEALRQVEMVKADGRKFLTPDAAHRLGDEALEPFLGPKLAQAQKAVMERLADHMAKLDQLATRFSKLEALAELKVPGARDLEAIDIKATLSALERQQKTTSALYQRVDLARDGQLGFNKLWRRVSHEIDLLAKAEKKIGEKMARDLDRMKQRIPAAIERRDEALAGIERVKAQMVRHLDRLDSLPGELELELGRLRDQAREDLGLKLHSLFSDRGEYAVIAPGARERAMLRQGTRAGTPEGEALRFITQFKAFPVAVISKAWGRELHGGEKGLARLAGITHMMVASTLSGYLAMSLKDMSKGRTPRDPNDPATWGAAFLQGGALGIYGDFLLGRVNRFGNSALETAAGPTLSGAAELLNIWNGARSGDDKSAAMLRFTLANTPFVNLFYTRAALDYLFFYQVQEAMNPGFLRRFEDRVRRDHGQTFLISPTKAIGVDGP